MLKRLIINKHYKFQFENMQNSYVLLYPEGRVLLNESASEILKLCNGNYTNKCIEKELNNRFGSCEGLNEFIKEALDNKWIKEID